jgi:hypothetical protein
MLAGISRTQSFLLGFVVLVVLTAGIGWLGKTMLESDPAGDLEFWHAGYFRDDSMNRLFTIAFLPSASISEVQRYARQLTYTPGHTTVAFFYPEGSRIPSTAVTGAASLADAKQALRTVTGASPWRYATLKDASGQLTLVDCEAEPGNALCPY